jgi:hypothetical protein
MRSEIINHWFCKLVLPLAVPLAFSYATATPAAADTLWYNGDPDGQGFAANQIFWLGQRQSNRTIWSDFTIPTTDEGWNIDTVWSNNLLYSQASAPTASWGIVTNLSRRRDDVPFLNGETVAFGRSPATITPTTFTVSNQPVSTLSVSGLNLYLEPGTYWLAVRPFYDLGDRFSVPAAAIVTTSDANAIGTPPGNNGNSFTVGYSIDFYPDNRDYSMGISGTVSRSIPEPTSMLGVLLFGVLGAGSLLKRK